MFRQDVASPQPGCTGRGKRFALILAGIALLLTLLPTGPAVASTREIEITATVTLSPLEVLASAPSRVLVGKVFRVDAIIRNRGDLKIKKAVASIYLPINVEIVGGHPKEDLGNIPAQKYTTVTWRLRALKEGNYVILISARGDYGGAIVTGEDVVLVTAAAR